MSFFLFFFFSKALKNKTFIPNLNDKKRKKKNQPEKILFKRKKKGTTKLLVVLKFVYKAVAKLQIDSIPLTLVQNGHQDLLNTTMSCPSMIFCTSALAPSPMGGITVKPNGCCFPTPFLAPVGAFTLNARGEP